MKKTITFITGLLLMSTLHAQTVSTVATIMGAPADVAVNSLGEVFFTDATGHKILKIETNGTVIDFAGSTQGFADGTGIAAQFNAPVGICINSSDELIVSDYSNHRIRKITPAGVVTTIAGNGTIGSDNGNGTNATFNGPVGICINSFGQIYVAQQGGHNIRVINTNGDVFTVAGAGFSGYVDGQGVLAQFAAPYDVAVDQLNNLYVADQNNHRIRKISATGTVTTFAGNGTQAVVSGNGINASFYTPWGVTYDPVTESVYTVGAGDVIQKIDNTAEVTTIAGFANSGHLIDGPALDARFKDPTGIAMGLNGEIFVADYYNNSVRKMTPANAGIENTDSQLNVNVYPNPTSSTLTIETEATIESVKIFNINGTLVHSEKANNFSVEALTSGVYLIIVRTAEGIVTKRIIKE